MLIFFSQHRTQKNYDINAFITCTSKHVIYISNVRVLSSTLDALNVHCMYILLAFVCNIKQSFEEHNLSRVDIMLDMMARIQQVLLFVALDKALLHWRGINMIRVMSRLETRWTFYIQTP